MSKSTKYKESMERLEEILEGIDGADIGVDELAERVDEAAKLLKVCKGILTKTQSKVSTVLNELEEDFEEASED
jgi:exodeoxyribonuclease VII small subunit